LFDWIIFRNNTIAIKEQLFRKSVIVAHRLERQFDASAPNEKWFRCFD